MLNQAKRKVEGFTAGCPLCEPVVELVQRIACASCDVTVHNLNEDPQAAARARAAGVHRVPMVLVDGKPADCCQTGPVTEAGLRAAGIGTT
jgi:glutaredoxin 3